MSQRGATSELMAAAGAARAVAYGDQLSGKTVVDITNPVDLETYAPLTLEAGSAAQEIARRAPL